MARGYQINGETLISVRGNDNTAKELGLASESVQVIPRWSHSDMKVNDFGPETPPDVQFQLAEVIIKFALIQFDDAVLKYCITEAMAGGTEGVINSAGVPMGGGWPVYTAKCHFMRMLLTSPQLGKPWRFMASYMLNPEYPLGTTASIVPQSWRVIPYREGTVTQGGTVLTIPAEIKAAGIVLWDRNDLSS